jgi:hypothetical protein
MDGQAVNAIAALVEEKTNRFDVDGRVFIRDGGFKEVVPKMYARIDFDDLEGFVDFVNKIDASDPTYEGGYFRILVTSYDKVTLMFCRDGVAHVIAVAKSGIDQFRFDEYMPIEEFRINLITKFSKGGDIAALMKYTSKITDKTEVTLGDDGVSMKMTISESSSGAVVDEKSFSSELSLHARRTFSEIAPVVSTYLLRIKKQSAALFDYSDGTWKLESSRLIRQYLSDNCTIDIE